MPIQHFPSLAQLVEQWTLNPWVVGSSPTGRIAIKKKGSLSTVVGDEKLTSREDRKGLLFLDVQGDEYTLSKVDKVSKTKSQTFDVFNQLVSSFKFCV